MIFFGDNGQGDVVCAERSLQAGLLKAAVIQEVQPRENTTSDLRLGSQEYPDQAARDAAWEKMKLFFVRTQVGAAVRLCALGYLTENGLKRVFESGRLMTKPAGIVHGIYMCGPDHFPAVPKP